MPFDVFGDYVEETEEEMLTRWEEEAARADEEYAKECGGCAE